MKAAVQHEYGTPDLLRVEEVPKPTPRDHEVLIRVRAASVNLGDRELLTGEPLYITVIARLFAPGPRRDPIAPTPGRGFLQPRYPILGSDIAGTVRPVIDRCYTLGEAGAALRRVGEKESLGKVIITL